MKKNIIIINCLLCITLSTMQAQTRFKTLNFLYSITGKYVLSGQHNDQKDGTNESYYTNRVNQITGKYPALYGADFQFHGSSQLRWNFTYEAERQWAKGAAISIMWHACPPVQAASCGWDGGIKSSLSQSQWNELLTNGSSLNNLWKSRIDEIAIYLQYLEDKGVEVLWRPFHEQNQTVFWWNSGGAEKTKALWRLTHDYMTNTKGLSNLIWVWDMQDLPGNFANWNPGTTYFDMAALDIYGSGYYDLGYYNSLTAQAGTKPVAIGECFNLPNAQVLQNLSKMSFFMCWAYGLEKDENNNPTNSQSYIKEVYGNARVLTLDEMPGWNTTSVPTNLATAKPVAVSSTEAGANVAANAVDGQYGTRWSSAYSDPQSLSVDLGASYIINRVKITWEAAYGKDFVVQVSADNVNWTAAKTVTGNSTLINDYTGLSSTGRYVRIYGTARGLTQYGYSIFELEVYGTPVPVNQAPTVSITSPVNNANFTAPATIAISANASDTDGSISKVDFYNGSTLIGTDNAAPYSVSWANVLSGSYSITARATDNNGAIATSTAIAIVVVTPAPTNLATGKPVIVSSTEAGANVAANAVDGQYGTRWSSAYADPQSLVVDLGGNYALNRIKITWEAAYGKDYLLQVSSNNISWTTIKTITGNTTLVNDHTALTGTGRYIQIYGTARGLTQYGYSIFELEVYGTSAPVNQAPTVSILSPANNANFTAPATITINANASDTDGSISKVDFYNGSTLIGTDNVVPYSVSWANVVSGSYSITAKATDNGGAISTSTAVTVVVNNPIVPNAMKVVAYVANWNDLYTYSNTIDYSKLTHINIAFENPNFNGDLSFNASDAVLIQKAHANNVKVFVSIGGGSASTDPTIQGNFFSLIGDSRRAGFVSKIQAYLRANNFDGLDVDLEGPAINGDYGKFIADLSASLKPAGKGLTAALSQGYGGTNVPSSTFANFDFINIMAYDATGPWDTSNPGQHSSYEFAQSNLQYWLGRGLPKSKAVLGVPFYGYGFGAASGEWPYSRIVSTYAGAENTDQAGNTIWYNGIPTIKKKVNYAFDQQIGGVMIWELAQDAPGAKSLLLAIDQVVKLRNNTPAPTNLATGKPVFVSSTEAGVNVAANAVDGQYGSRWSSLYTNAEWIYVDLGANYNVNRVKLTWEVAYGKDYQVQISTNASTWTSLKTITGNASLINDHTGLSGTGRYVRINGTARGTEYGYSLYEIEVYGTVGAIASLAQMSANTMTTDNSSDILFVSPNPVDGVITINSSVSTKVRVLNARGVEVVSERMVAPNGSLDVAFLASGAYYVHIYKENILIRKKILKN